MVKKLLMAGAVLMLLAFVALPVSAAVCPNPDCPNSDCEPKDYNWQGTKNAGQQTVSGVCPNPDCIPNENDYQYLSPGPHKSGRNI